MSKTTETPTTKQSRGLRKTVTVSPKRQDRTGMYVLGGLGLLLLLFLGLILLTQRRPGDIAEVETFAGEAVARGHQDGQLSYAVIPPVGGIHNNAWQNCGIYDEPVANELAVHSLEHGAVWITYRPDLPIDELAVLRSLVRNRTYTMLSPYEGLPSPIVASAWGVQLQVDEASDGRLGQFVAKYRQGEQTPEPGALCTGGIGEPID